ncbi:MAG: UDP-4-amino-4,6-dideoxy-N-acetyl-beta-L-altrosamine transaminase [Candidatus Omnitrophica bacterium]|nr:UDP-4-amino-4,6-dideoxy-N-acetyl-beta-L-altrosamine transaminase [Candidatus Omnitrophota bacterium]
MTNMRIPYGHHHIDESDIKEVVKALKSNWITQGPKIKEFENALCEYTGSKYAVAVSSGTAALHMACLAAGVKEGDEVITSPITFVASANCVLYCGGRPVFTDIQEDTVNIDPEEIKKKINKKTKAIIPVHFAGHPCDLEEIYKIAKENNLIVIEDACHALGAEYKGFKIGACKYSDMTVFSFHPVKSITTGEGGAVLTNREDLYEKLVMLRNHGITKDDKKFINKGEGGWYYEMQELGFNYRITDFQCALGISQLKKLDKFIKRRREIVQIYNKELSKIEEVILPLERPYVKSSWHIYYIRLRKPEKREFVFKQLQKKGIGVQVHYIPVYCQPYYKNKLGLQKYPKAGNYYNSTITIPLYYGLKKDEINYIIESLKETLSY